MKKYVTVGLIALLGITIIVISPRVVAKIDQMSAELDATYVAEVRVDDRDSEQKVADEWANATRELKDIRSEIVDFESEMLRKFEVEKIKLQALKDKENKSIDRYNQSIYNLEKISQ